jgi:hypothetical protein
VTDNILPPHIEGVRPIDVSVEPRAQRKLDPRRVNAIVGKFQPDSLGTPAVSRRPDGTIVAVDGQHRIAALVAKGLGEIPLPCQVYEGLTVAQEAALFRRLNDSKNITTADGFRIAVTEGDAVAIQAERRLRVLGWTMEQGRKNTMRSLSTIYNWQERDPLALRRALEMLCTAWGATPQSGDAILVNGFAMWCTRYGLKDINVDWMDLPPKLGKIRGGAQMFKAEVRANADVRNITRPDAVADKLTNLYNARKKEHNQLPMWTPGR